MAFSDGVATDIRRAALSLLARREHSRTELARKLLRRGVDGVQLQAELDRLVEEGWLSDARYLESLVRTRALAGYGPIRIRAELAQQGLSAASITEALQCSEFDWSAVLAQVWRRKFAACVPNEAGARAKQMRFLVYRGFSPDAVAALWRSQGT